jgi:hypothetical protein
MFTSIRLATVLAGLALAISAGIALAQTQSRVAFEAGNDNSAVDGKVTGQEYVDYLLGAKAGQAMGVSLTVNESDGNGTVYFNILPPGSSGEAIYNSSSDGNDAVNVMLPADGDYTIRVYQMGNDEDTGKTSSFTISVVIM